ncbi:Gfo/Idh/MocA family protein [Paenibacillus yanchengensis]|uniref:Gfo/Idh/MocA family protein n=1 Tax=Paenibacillus yanchengensis TaxID=2035833 RepID=A0ABW4YFU3_9BACL
MEKMKFAIIGCEHAHITIFIEEMLQLGHIGIGIVEKRNMELASSLSEKYEIPLVDDEETLMAEADFIGCAAINNEKIAIIERCEQFGKSVMIDKPAVTNRQDAKRLEEVIARKKIEVGMLLTERFNPVIFTLQQQIVSGSLGEIVSIQMRKPHQLNAAKRPPWFFSKEQCGGIIIDLFIHDYDLLRWFTSSEVASSDGQMTKRNFPQYAGFYDTASMQVMMDNGVIAQLYADWYTPDKSWTWGDGRIFVVGTEGVAELRLAGDPFVSKDALLLQTTNVQQAVQVPLIMPEHNITEDFLLRLNGKTSFIQAQDVMQATWATIEADERVQIMQIPVVEGEKV